MLGRSLRALMAVFMLAPAALAAADEALAAIDGQKVIPIDDLLYFYQRQFPGPAPATAAEALERLDLVIGNILTGEILRIEAEARGFGDDVMIKATLAAEESQNLRAYYRGKMAEAITIDEAAVQAFYDKAKQRRLYGFITTDTKTQADEAWAELEAGRSWRKVLRKYSTFKHYPNADGTWPAPMGYGGDPVSEALFALEPGEYTTPLSDAFGLSWSIYRSIKKVHGDGRGFDEARGDVVITLQNRELQRQIEELAKARRDTAPITRDPQIWDAVKTKSLSELRDLYYGKGMAISTVDWIPVGFDEVLDVVPKAAPLGPEELEALRQTKPDRYEAIWDDVTRHFEEEAVLEYEARREGILDEPAVARNSRIRRTELLIQKFYEEDFLAALPPPTDEEIQKYYEDHRAEFLTPERTEVYLAAMPKEKELKDFYKKVKKGTDMVVTGEARIRARAEASDAKEELPPPVAPENSDFYGTIIITAAPSEGENPLAAELRPRVFPFQKLNEPSEIFRLADGRWAFYMPIYHVEAQQHGLDEAEVLYFCRKGVQAGKVQESDAVARAWLDAVRARHRIWVDLPAIERLAASLAAPPPEN